MGNVWKAIKKHESEQSQAKEAPPASAASPLRPPGPAAVEPPGRRAPIPRTVTTNSYSKVLMAHHDRGGMITEQYRTLRTNLLAQYADKRFCLMLTSAEAGEGKTVTALNLALVLAERQECRTVVVDGDLRKSRVASLLRVKGSPGMSELLRGKATLSEAVQPTVYPNLFVVAAGEAKHTEVGELLGRPELEETVGELRRQYDQVLFDTSPVNLVSDTGMIGRAVGDALLVVRMNKTHRESVDKAIRLLHAVNVRIVGMVLTHQKYYIPDYLYRYS